MGAQLERQPGKQGFVPTPACPSRTWCEHPRRAPDTAPQPRTTANVDGPSMVIARAASASRTSRSAEEKRRCRMPTNRDPSQRTNLAIPTRTATSTPTMPRSAHAREGPGRADPRRLGGTSAACGAAVGFGDRGGYGGRLGQQTHKDLPDGSSTPARRPNAGSMDRDRWLRCRMCEVKRGRARP